MVTKTAVSGKKGFYKVLMNSVPIEQVIRKGVLLLSILPKNPLEVYDRLMSFLEVRLEKLWIRTPDYQSSGLDEVILKIEQNLGMEEHFSFCSEPTFIQIEGEVRRRIKRIHPEMTFPIVHNADIILAQLCYLICRVIRPAIVLETGVAYGVTTAFMLKALEANGYGLLHSVDLPPLARNADKSVGFVIPHDLKHRWRLHRGVSKRLLPSLLTELGQIDVFVHDSLHTYRNIRRELQMVTPYLAKSSAVIADDIDKNQAFREWIRYAQPAFWAAVQEEKKKSLFGISIFL